MTRFSDPAFFGQRYAGSYDDGPMPDPAPAVEFLAGLAGAGPVLELAIGTGRVALPLAARGVAVEGVEASPAMVEALRAKPGGAAVEVTVADMADVPVRGPYPLVYLVFNTLFNLISQERQVDCFANTARVLAPGGVFVIECFVPDPGRFDHGQRVCALRMSEDHAVVSVERHDPLTQQITYQRLLVDASGVHLSPLLLRYCWPSELDLMARLAGLRLRERYADFSRRPFDETSTSHVSVYERPHP